MDSFRFRNSSIDLMEDLLRVGLVQLTSYSRDSIIYIQNADLCTPYTYMTTLKIPQQTTHFVLRQSPDYTKTAKLRGRPWLTRVEITNERAIHKEYERKI